MQQAGQDVAHTPEVLAGHVHCRGSGASRKQRESSATSKRNLNVGPVLLSSLSTLSHPSGSVYKKKVDPAPLGGRDSRKPRSPPCQLRGLSTRIQERNRVSLFLGRIVCAVLEAACVSHTRVRHVRVRFRAHVEGLIDRCLGIR